MAGDREAGRSFLRWLVPFIWRKHLDFAAIQDIHSIKRQINAHRGGGRIALAGHNIKLGRGGIREIEFFAQTQQLIWGGRIPSVRASGTIDALAALARAGKIGAEVAAELTHDYRLLRRVEHRLQMIDDAQTHTLPEDPAKLAALATFLGYPGVTEFRGRAVDDAAPGGEPLRRAVRGRAGAGAARRHRRQPGVHRRRRRSRHAGAPWSGWASAMCRLVDAAVRGWHHGRCRAMRSTRARELLTELMPHLLKALAEKPDPDAAFLAFDRFLNGLPAGVQLFSMFYANPPLLGLVTDILGVAPALADHLARRPSVLESVLSAPDFFQPPPTLDELVDELRRVMDQARYAEDLLDLSRRWANDRRFQVGVQSLKGLIDTAQATAAWTRVADAALICLLPHVEAEFALAHGRIPGCGMAIVGMGKLGGREMTSTSDLDLIFVYATPDEATTVSDGARPLPAPQYFARLSQRLINAITAPTAEGRLYEVDMRLRPSGKAGPIAVSATTFARYQREEAWVWEQMALTRARVVAGPADLAAEIEAAIRSVLTRPRDPAALVVEVADMRARLAEELQTQSIWDAKHVRGGLVDIEFIAQYLQLRHAHAVPEVLSPNTREALSRLRAAGVLAPDAADDLDRRSRIVAGGAASRSPEHRRGDRGRSAAMMRRSRCGLPSMASPALISKSWSTRCIPWPNACTGTSARSSRNRRWRRGQAPCGSDAGREREDYHELGRRRPHARFHDADRRRRHPIHRQPSGQDDGLYFYPRDDTPGCTTEAQAFRDALPRLHQRRRRAGRRLRRRHR